MTTPTPSMRQALEWTAATLQSLSNSTLSENSTFTISGVKRSIREILDEADAALAPSEQPQKEAADKSRARLYDAIWQGSMPAGEASRIVGVVMDIVLAPQHPTHPENIRTGQPYDDPAFEQLAREHDVWGRASSALCAVFWMAGKDAQGQDARDAARYRWLRDTASDIHAYRITRECESELLPGGEHFVSLDAAIDAAMTAPQGDEPEKVECPGCGERGEPNGKDGEYRCGSGLSGGCTR